MNKEELMLLVETINGAFPKRLKKYREKSGLTLRETAKMIGKSPGQLSLWERGINPPSCIDLFKLCIVYEIILSDLFPEICEDSNPIGKAKDLGFYKKYLLADEEVKTTIQKILEYTQKGQG